MRIWVHSSIGNIPTKSSSKWLVGNAVGIILPMRFCLIIIYWKEEKIPDSVEHVIRVAMVIFILKRFYLQKNFFKLLESQKNKLNLVKNTHTYQIILEVLICFAFLFFFLTFFFKLRSEIKSNEPTSNSLHRITNLMFMSPFSKCVQKNVFVNVKTLKSLLDLLSISIFSHNIKLYFPYGNMCIPEHLGK